MDILYVVVLIVNIVSALGVIGLVLMQHGKGADMGAAFGSGASGSLFGAPNKLPEAPLPKAAPMSAPLPCCISTRPITPSAETMFTISTTT